MAKSRRNGGSEPTRTVILAGLLAAAARIAADEIVRAISDLVGGGNPLC